MRLYEQNHFYRQNFKLGKSPSEQQMPSYDSHEEVSNDHKNVATE